MNEISLCETQKQLKERETFWQHHLKTFCLLGLKDTLKAFDDFKNKQKNVLSNVFLICKSMFILKVYSILYTLR